MQNVTSMTKILSEQEEIVLSVVREYLNKNRYFNIKNVLPFIQSRFRRASINININGIETILKSLVKKKLIVEGSKLTREEILHNIKRARIYNFIEKNPGTYFNKIVSELNISNHIVVWHLNMLIKFGYIKKDKLEKHDVYFDSEIDFNNVKINYYLSNSKCEKIIGYLHINDTGINKTNLSTNLGMHINTIQKYLTILEEIGVIYKKVQSNNTLYFLNPL
ncbi:MAG: hypothetical protein ACFE9T_10540 [Promethearchaeota archaeon]